MPKRVAALAVSLTAIVAIFWLGADAARLLTERNQVMNRIQMLPPIEFIGPDENVHALRDLPVRPTILFFFATTCPFCETELVDLVQHSDLFTESNVVLITPEDISSVQSFSKHLGLDSLAHFWIGYDSEASIGRLFGVKKIPSVFVYDRKGRLTRRFHGLNSAIELASALEGAG